MSARNVRTIEVPIEWFDPLVLSDIPTVVQVNTEAAISELVVTLDRYRPGYAVIFIDIQGVSHSGHETISIMQIYDAAEHVVYLMDVSTLGERCFITPAPARHKRTLKDILENTDVKKAFFDVRNDSKALYTQYGIVLEGVHDIQLMELATRSLCRGYVSGLATCIARNDTIPAEDVLRWINMGGGQFSADFNSAFEDFKQRPFSNGTRRHCPQKFKLLVRLYDHYSSELTPEWKARMVSATKDRVRQSQSAGVDDHEIDMGRAPDGWHEIEDCPGESANFYPGRVGR
ncbi:3' 5' exonuclease [Fusarium acuminatum]|jgi:exonuclease 3'-5' domain-containing protein 1|uniref:3' 5' exonuclease n=1 Tax=Fusarium acuminatum TaxID=5515 RepID=A0ABZ2WPT3_9HYPO